MLPEARHKAPPSAWNAKDVSKMRRGGQGAAKKVSRPLRRLQALAGGPMGGPGRLRLIASWRLWLTMGGSGKGPPFGAWNKCTDRWLGTKYLRSILSVTTLSACTSDRKSVV